MISTPLLRPVLLALFCSILGSLAVHAQNEIGIVGGGAYNDHNASFGKLGTYPSCCPEFTGGSGMGFYLGGWYGLALNDRFRLLGRLTFSTENGSMTDEEQSFVADLRDTAKVVDATFTHQLDATLSSIGIEPLLAFRVVGGLDLMLGARVGLTLTTSFHQTETLTKPEDYGTYLGDDRVWVDTEADIPDAAGVRATLVGGVRYVLPIGRGRSTFLAPEFTYHLPLTGVASNVTWDVAQIRFGIALGWQISSSPATDTTNQVPAEPPAFIPPPPAVVIVPAPTASITVSGRMPDGTVINDPMIQIEETQVTTLHPLLGHIYFNEGASDIPQRYLEGIERARTDTIGLSPLEAAHGELAIIAQRLAASPRATIKVTGHTSGTATDNGMPLARARAERVRDKLIELGVAPSRISVSASNVPTRATKGSDPEMAVLAAEENRRVEITSSDASISGPVSLGSIAVSVAPSMLRLQSNIYAAGGVRTAQVTLRQGNEVIDMSDQRAVADRYRDVSLETADLRKLTGSPFIASLSVTDSLGKSTEAVDTISVKHLTISNKRVENLGDILVERFDLVLFEFNDVAISGDNARLLEYVRSRMKPSTTVKVIGATDVMGSDEYNRDLSLRRAREVARLLNVPDAAVEGIGEADPNFPNDLPEGRAYNRTVVIELVSPVR
ncbi:MAG: OmpA family protein [Ignavibacteria bacterium]|nr:OmpA family protein [Ignavibacteria bacterium]